MKMIKLFMVLIIFFLSCTPKKINLINLPLPLEREDFLSVGFKIIDVYYHGEQLKQIVLSDSIPICYSNYTFLSNVTMLSCKDTIYEAIVKSNPSEINNFGSTANSVKRGLIFR